MISPEIAAILIGVVCGVAAGIPVSIFIIYLMLRRQQAGEDYSEEWR